jgi:hypothetical protein
LLSESEKDHTLCILSLFVVLITENCLYIFGTSDWDCALNVLVPLPAGACVALVTAAEELIKRVYIPHENGC